MPSYSVATTKDNFSSLIDKALAGEEVIITRHGKPVVGMHVVAGIDVSKAERVRALDELSAVRETLPTMEISYLELKRLDGAEGER